MGGYIGVGIVLLILGFGLAFLINDVRKRINNSNKYNITWNDLLIDANWHLQNGKFDYSRKSYENNGCNPIILKL